MKEELAKRDSDLASEIAKAQASTEAVVAKDQELVAKAQAINQLRTLGRKYKGQSADSETKFKKVCGASN